MGEDTTGCQEALAALRRRLADGLARSRMTKTQLATRTGLGRTTVQQAFRVDGPVPSAETIAALALALGLPTGDLLGLHHQAAEGACPSPRTRVAPGRPIGEWDPHDLEVHPSGAAGAADSLVSRSARRLSGYIRRAHDGVLAEVVREAAEGRSGMLVLVGSSSTGKTRACWEAVQPLAHAGWRLWHPYDPTRAEAVLADIQRVTPHTVVWLNEAQHYMGDPQAGERIAAALQTLLTDASRGPVVILGTLWPEYADRYLARPADPDAPDPHSQAREVLSGRTLAVPDTFDKEALQAATVLAHSGDQLLSDALTRAARHGRLAQDLAGAPELLRRYELGSPAVRALLEAAMDARRLGVGLHLPQAFLIAAAADYLADHDWENLTEGWAEAAFADLARPVHGKQAPLRPSAIRPARRPADGSAPAALPGPVAGVTFRLADYLEQHGRSIRKRLCPPASFWHAGRSHLARPKDLQNLATAATGRYRLQWADHLLRRAAEAGHPSALCDLARRRERAGDLEGAEELYRRAAEGGDTDALTSLVWLRQREGDLQDAEDLAQQAADAGDPTALYELARARLNARDLDGAEVLGRRTAAAGNPLALYMLAVDWEQAGDTEHAETLAQLVAEAGDTRALCHLVWSRRQAGNLESAESPARLAANAGDTSELLQLAQLRREAGEMGAAEALFRQAADAGDADALCELAKFRGEAGDWEGAETFARRAVDAGNLLALRRLMGVCRRVGNGEAAEDLFWRAVKTENAGALYKLAQLRELDRDREGAERLFRRAVDAGETRALCELAEIREVDRDPEGAEALVWRGFDVGDIRSLHHLLEFRVDVGDWEGAEALAQRAAAARHTDGLCSLAELRGRAGDWQHAENLARQAAEAGNPNGWTYLVENRQSAGDLEGAEIFARRAADAGAPRALFDLALARRQAGDRLAAEACLRHAADAGSTDALRELTVMREQAEDWEEAEALARRAADAGLAHVIRGLAVTREMWPYGLDPDGSPTSAWT